MAVIRDRIAESIFTTAVDRLTKVAKKNGIDDAEAEAIFAAVLRKHWPQTKLPLGNGSPK